jgi:hypothetical protein
MDTQCQTTTGSRPSLTEGLPDHTVEELVEQNRKSGNRETSPPYLVFERRDLGLGPTDIGLEFSFDFGVE